MINETLLRDLGSRINQFISESPAREDMQKTLNSLIQNAFNSLDLVTREQFDAQLETLEQARTRIDELEAQLAELTQQLDDSTNQKK